MTAKENYLGLFLFLVISPTLLLLAPGVLTYGFITVLVVFYGAFFIRKPRRRCVPCGEIVPLTPYTYIRSLQNSLPCPRCGSTIKNSHRV